MLFIELLLLPLESDHSQETAPATEDRLEAAPVDGDDVIEALIVISVDPVCEVQSTVGAENEDIAEDERLSFAGLSDHEELGDDGDTLQVDGECPENLHHRELMIDPQSQD